MISPRITHKGGMPRTRHTPPQTAKTPQTIQTPQTTQTPKTIKTTKTHQAQMPLLPFVSRTQHAPRASCAPFAPLPVEVCVCFFWDLPSFCFLFWRRFCCFSCPFIMNGVPSASRRCHSCFSGFFCGEEKFPAASPARFPLRCFYWPPVLSICAPLRLCPSCLLFGFCIAFSYCLLSELWKKYTVCAAKNARRGSRLASWKPPKTVFLT